MDLVPEYTKLRRVALFRPRAEDIIMNHLYEEMPDPEGVRAEIGLVDSLLCSLGVDVEMLSFPAPPNMIFLRDLALVGLPKYSHHTTSHPLAMLSRMFHKERESEPYLLGAALDALGIWVDTWPLGGGSFEASDLLVTDKAYYACGNRSKPQMLTHLKRRLNMEVEMLDNHELRVPQHLLGCKVPFAENRVLSRDEVLRHNLGCFAWLPVEESEETTAGYGMNILVLGPNEIIMPSGCPELKAQYEASGIKVRGEVVMPNILKMGGGLACICLPLRRSS